MRRFRPLSVTVPSFRVGVKASAVLPQSQQDIKVNAEVISILEKSAIRRLFVPAIVCSAVTFVSVQVGLACDRYLSARPLCSLDNHTFPVWYWFASYCILGGFIVTWAAMVLKVYFSPRANHELIPCYITLYIVTTGTIANILNLVLDRGGVCVDALNVASPAYIWGEWLANGPLLIFITVTISGKGELMRLDWILMATFFLSLLFGFFIIFEQPEELASFWLVLSCLFYLPTVYLPFYRDSQQLADVMFSRASLELLLRRQQLSLWLSVVLPLFAVNYFIALGGRIDYAMTVIIYQALLVLTKSLFATTVMDSHIYRLRQIESELNEEKRANDARRNFMKHIFHEVRTPLNSLALGLQVLSDSTNLDPVEQESLLMMKSAAGFMSDTLNDVLSIQKIEEGKFELDRIPFSIREAVHTVLLACRGATTNKNINVVRNVDSDVPLSVLGDRFQIEHVIANLLGNAIKFSPEGGKIEITVKATKVELDHAKGTVKTAQLCVAISDEGPGISKENQLKLFNNFVQIRPNTLQKGQGSGLGLALCKKIVELHDGTIGVQSSEGNGSIFSFQIPFPVLLRDNLLNEISTDPHPEVGACEFLIADIETGSQAMISNSDKFDVSSRSALPTMAQRSPFRMSRADFDEHRLQVHSSSSELSRSKASLGEYREYVISTLTKERAKGSSSEHDLNEHATAAVASSKIPLKPDLTANTQIEATQAPNEISFQASLLSAVAESVVNIDVTEKHPVKDILAMIVDDVESNRKMLGMLLKRKNISSVMMADGSLAVEFIKKDLHACDVIFMDNLMPNMGGVEAASLLRAMGYNKIIVGVTGNVLTDDLHEYLSAGANLILSKPMRFNHLEALLQFIKVNGTVAPPNMQLQDREGGLRWVPFVP